MIVDIYLRGADRVAVDYALLSAGLIDENGRTIAESARLSRIGTILRATGEVDGEGSPVTESVPGYHANLRMLREPTEAEIAALAPVTIDTPVTPWRVWFD